MMSATQGRSNGESAPAQAVFSYAQAAKGRPASTTATAVQSHQSGASGLSTPSKETSSTVDTPLGGSEGGDRSVNGSLDVPSKPETTADPIVVTTPNSNGADHTTKVEISSQPISAPASPSFGTASTATLPKEETDEFTLVGPSESSRDRVAQSGQSSVEKSTEQGEARRSKKTKKQKNSEKEKDAEKEKEKEESKPENLVPAPLPMVNFWQQRKEEFAKTKPITAVAPTPADLSVKADSSIVQKKRGKAGGALEEDKLSQASQNGVRDGTPAARGQKKGPDGTTKTKEEHHNKRTGPRGSRLSEQDEKSSQGPPPPGDPELWPTPETSAEDEKRKLQEKPDRDEKDDGTHNKNRTKWVPVPFVPPVVFNTPMPPRGGRGRGGARGGRTEGGRPREGVNGTNGAEKAQGNSNEEGASVMDGESASNNKSRAASLPPPKRHQNEQANARKPTLAQDKAKVSRLESGATSDIRMAPNGFQSDQVDNGLEQKQSHPDVPKVTKQEQLSNPYQESLPRAERKYDSSKGAESYREAGLSNNKDSGYSRGVSERSERRGGYRGRAVHGNFTNGQTHPQHSFLPNGQGSQQSNGYSTRQNSAPYSPPLQQAPFSNQYAPPSRGRGSSRPQSITGAAIYGRFGPNGGPNGGPLSQHMAPIQTSNQMYDYQHLQSLNTAPYNSYVDETSLVQLVTMQIEYYFSIDNLCKDVYLRKHMDSQGFVFLSFIAGFKRIKSLTTNFELLKFACQESAVVDMIQGEDGKERVRRAEGWDKWIMALEERDESVRNGGPSQHSRPHPMHKNPQMGPMGIPGHHSMSPLTFSPNGMPPAYTPYGNGIHMAPTMNGNGNYHQETPLSAAVAEFSPGPFTSNGKSNPLDAETTFHDDEVANLTMVFASPQINDEAKAKVPFHNASSRTFSNGSIDGRSIAEELHDDRQSRPMTNGVHTTDVGFGDFRRSRSPLGPLSPTSSTSNGPPVMWVKGQRQQATVSEHNSQELYATFRLRALKHREASALGETHSDMNLLYEFWSHFLCRNFNAHMYTEFRNCALQDAQNSATKGMKNLISYYDELLNSKRKVIPECLARHYVDLVQHEDSAGDRPAFEKLRAAWRNGALDVKSRKQIDNLIGPQLREELS